ncbi:uncharacterized protein LOC110818064 [Carica papaya]|uniref:uncharacterized protein LOC110818064 n=1 Tax=Carica papaya TaxID=3649 RepID=UPI000B8C7A95|nr:uncharacterized protein LOC110818064 [Carica papaya]
MPTWTRLVQVLFGCQRAGLLTIPLLPPHPSFHKPNYHHFLRVVSQTRPKAAVAPPHYIALVQQYTSSCSSSVDPDLVVILRNLIWISTEDIKHGETTASRGVMDSPSYNGCKVDEVYLIQYTSGATGIPKPVLVTAGSAAHNVRTARKAYDLHPNSIIVSWLPQYHDCGLMFLLLTIVSGATCVLTSPASFVNRPMLWLEMLSDLKSTCTPVPSFALTLVMRHHGKSDQKENSNLNLLCLKNLILINEPLYKSSVEEFLHVFQPYGLNPSCIAPSYGLAENCTFVSTAWRNNKNDCWDYFPSHKQLLPSAKLADQLDEVEIIIVDEQTKEAVEDGIEGEIWISSPSNASGYLGHPFLSQKIFQGRLKNKISSRYYVRTGDRGIVKGQERFLYVTGRCVDIIKTQNNQEIHPHYIETAAYNCYPQFLRGGCLACFSISRTITLVAELQGSEKLDQSILRRLCEGIKQDVLKEENVKVGRVILVKRGCVPRTTSGKIQRWAAMDKLVRNQMSIVMDLRTEQAGGFDYSFPTLARRGKLRRGVALSLM